MRINYVTNLPLGQTRGGWDGMNTAMHAELSRRFDVKYVGPVSPGIPLLPRISARLSRWAGVPESAYFFSRSRLSEYAKAVTGGCDPQADLDFFHGSTPWVVTRPGRPYFAYVDAPFHAYAALYHGSRFDPAEVDRISRLEAAWLRAAAAVFFSSEWAYREAASITGGYTANFRVVGLGGAVAAPTGDTYAGGQSFMAVTTDFERKGGMISLEAFKLVRQARPNVSLDFLGVRPPDSVLLEPGVRYLGYLDKTNQSDLRLYTQILSSSFASLLPTAADTTPILIPEAAYFGCPTIASRLYGIPELIEHGHTGLLLPPPVTPMSLAAGMRVLLDSGEQYRRMRSRARALALEKFTWTAVGERLSAHISAVVANAKRRTTGT